MAKERKLDRSGNPVVTKEELEKSGMTLRDFLNKERGLTRRGEPKAAKEEAMREANMPAGYTGDDARGEQDMSKYKPRRDVENLSGARRPGTNVNYENPNSSDMTFKRGGKVGSASKRGDGIATKGKTKGTMVKMNYGGKC
jgi:hypothetical protein